MEALVAYLSHCLLYREEISERAVKLCLLVFPCMCASRTTILRPRLHLRLQAAGVEDEHLFLAAERFHLIDGCRLCCGGSSSWPGWTDATSKRASCLQHHPPPSAASPPVACAQLLQSPSHSSNGLSFSSLLFSVVGRPCDMMRYTIYVGVRHYLQILIPYQTLT